MFGLPDAAICESGSCRCAIIGVPWRLRGLSLFSICFWQGLEDKAKHAETDPRHGTLPIALVHRLPMHIRKGNFVGSSSQANYLERNAAMDDSIGD